MEYRHPKGCGFPRIVTADGVIATPHQGRLSQSIPEPHLAKTVSQPDGFLGSGQLAKAATLMPQTRRQEGCSDAVGAAGIPGGQDQEPALLPEQNLGRDDLLLIARVGGSR